MAQKGQKRTYHKMKDRIRQIMEAQHMTQKVFANYIGTNPATLCGIFNDRTRPTINIIESIKKKFPDIRLEWLMFGEGEMYSSGHTGESEENDEGNVPHPDNQSSQFPMVEFDTNTPSPSSPSSRTPQTVPHHNSVRNTQQEIVREEVKYIDKPPRRVTEIRVYYDDQTWESFVPTKK